jgi:hypothetical protein
LVAAARGSLPVYSAVIGDVMLRRQVANRGWCRPCWLQQFGARQMDLFAAT